MSDNMKCPEPEELAAWTDGRLDSPRRQVIVEHLDTCPYCFDLVAGAVAFRQEADPDRPVLSDDTVRSFRAVPRWAVPVAAAAVLILVAVLIAVVPVRMAGPEPTAGVSPTPAVPSGVPAPVGPAAPDPAADSGRRLTETDIQNNVLASIRTVMATPEADPAALVATVRLPESGAYGFGAPPTAGWFRLGVRWVEAELHLQAHDRSAAADTLALIRGDLVRLGVASRPLAELERAETVLRRGQETGLPAEFFTRTLAAGGKRGSARMELGAWVAGGRIAIQTGHGEYFDRLEMKRLQVALAAEECPPGVSNAFEEIRRQIGAGLPNAASFRRVDRALVDIGLLMQGE